MCSMRHNIDLLLLEIWLDPAQKRALTQLARQAAAAPAAPNAGEGAGARTALLVDYARALLNSLMYMLGVTAFALPLPRLFPRLVACHKPDGHSEAQCYLLSHKCPVCLRICAYLVTDYCKHLDTLE